MNTFLKILHKVADAMLGTVLLILFAVLLYVLLCPAAKADTFQFTPYASMGAGKMDTNLTDKLIADNPEMGSHTPGYIEAGLIVEPLRQPLWVRAITLCADQVDIGWRHQSYVNRGGLLVYDFGGQEAQIDAYAINFIWKFQSLSWSW